MRTVVRPNGVTQTVYSLGRGLTPAERLAINRLSPERLQRWTMAGVRSRSNP